MSQDPTPTAPRLRVAAVFATMNRAATAVACVRSLASQTCPPESVVVADNNSSDGTAAALESLSGLPFELILLALPQNVGNAGGVDEAMEAAFARGADAVWILDDDSWPRPDALEAMLAKPWDPRVVRHALQLDPKTGRFTWPLQVDDGSGGWRMVDAPNEMPPGDFIRSRIMWTGALLPREAWESTGPVNRGLFIRGEDEEYPWRLEQAGFPQEAVRNAVMDHPGPENIVHWRMLGKNFFFEQGLADWKLYYKARNMVWLKRRQSGLLKAFGMALAYVFAVCRIDGARRLPLAWEAVRDGLDGKLGKWRRHPM